MQRRKNIENFLSTADVWKILLKRGVRLYPDGFYRLSGIFGRSVTFGFLKAGAEEVQAIRDKDCSIKEPWLSELAYFMKKRGSSDSDLIICDNQVLVVLGIERLVLEAGSFERQKKTGSKIH